MSQAAELPKEKMEAVYTSAGQEIKLSAPIVKSFLAKGSSEVSDADIVQFISLCKYNELNPFLNEAYLVKYAKDAPAQMVVSKEAFMKRADASPNYDGYKAGIIVKRGNDVVFEEGSFMLPTDVLLGGWCEVYRSDKKNPIVSRVSLSEYNTGKSLWNGKQSTMIRKVALVQAHREAFPSQLGAMYVPDELNVQDTSYEEVKDTVKKEISENAGKKTMTMAIPQGNTQTVPTNTAAKDPEPVKIKSKSTEEAKAKAAEAPAPSGDDEVPDFFQ